jgi:AraC-like DNA-binding protein
MSLRSSWRTSKWTGKGKLLLDKDRKNNDIAETLGYNRHRYYRKNTKTYGHLPTEYRKPKILWGLLKFIWFLEKYLHYNMNIEQRAHTFEKVPFGFFSALALA